MQRKGYSSFSEFTEKHSLLPDFYLNRERVSSLLDVHNNEIVSIPNDW